MQVTRSAPKSSTISIQEKVKTNAPAKTLHIYDLVVPRLQDVVAKPLAPRSRTFCHERRNTQMLMREFREVKRELVKKYGNAVRLELRTLADVVRNSLALSIEGQEAFSATLKIYRELVEQNYTTDQATTYLQFATHLLQNHLQGGAVRAAKKAEAVMQQLLGLKEFEVLEGDDKGNSNSYAILQDGQRSLRVKESRQIPLEKEIKRHDPYCYSSFLSSFPEMPLTTNVSDHELIGYEMDALLGLDRTPLTFQATIGVDAQNKTPGSLQLYVNDAKSADSYLYEPNQVENYANLDKSKVHLSAFSGMLKGLTAHHWGNYLMKEANGKIVDLFEIDMEEIMPPFNRVPASVTPSIAGKSAEEIAAKIETIKDCYVLCRLYILGLWQSKASFDKAFLMLITHPSLKILLDGYHENVLKKQTTMHPDCLQAQKERLEILQQLSRTELAKPTIEASPRDFYFALFGGKKIYEIAKAKNFPDLTIFNQIIADPYPGAYKDFANPDSLKVCTLLQPVTEQDSESRKTVKLNLQSIEKLY